MTFQVLVTHFILRWKVFNILLEYMYIRKVLVEDPDTLTSAMHQVIYWGNLMRFKGKKHFASVSKKLLCNNIHTPVSFLPPSFIIHSVECFELAIVVVYDSYNS